MSEIKEKILNKFSSIKREGITDLIDYITNKTDYFVAPASTQYHSNYDEGLAIHSDLVDELFSEKNIRFNLGLSQDSVHITSLTHDLCKTGFYKKGLKNVKEGKKIDWKGKEVDNWVEKEGWEIDDQLPLGHGEKSIILLQRFIPLLIEEVMIIRWHMGTPEDYISKKAYEVAITKYPSIVAFHCADMEAGYLLEKVIK
jgi:hypothetical protein